MLGLRARFVPFLERSLLALLYLGYAPFLSLSFSLSLSLSLSLSISLSPSPSPSLSFSLSRSLSLKGRWQQEHAVVPLRATTPFDPHALLSLSLFLYHTHTLSFSLYI